MAGEAVGVYDGKTNGQFTSLMAAAAETQSEAARKLARLQTLQKSESVRLREREVAAKEHEKQERWNNAAPVQKPANPEQPKKPTPVWLRISILIIATNHGGYVVQKAIERSFKGRFINFQSRSKGEASSTTCRETTISGETTGIDNTTRQKDAKTASPTPTSRIKTRILTSSKGFCREIYPIDKS
jgi:hypothetical protein